MVPIVVHYLMITCGVIRDGLDVSTRKRLRSIRPVYLSVWRPRRAPVNYGITSHTWVACTRWYHITPDRRRPVGTSSRPRTAVPGLVFRFIWPSSPHDWGVLTVSCLRLVWGGLYSFGYKWYVIVLIVRIRANIVPDDRSTCRRIGVFQCPIRVGIDTVDDRDYVVALL